MVDLLFFYDPALPTHKDWVRYYLGDTLLERVEIDDREITAQLIAEPEPEPAEVDGEPTTAQWRSYRQLVAARCAESIAAKHARDADVSFDNQRVGLSSKFHQYMALAKRLKSEAHASGPLRTIRW